MKRIGISIMEVKLYERENTHITIYFTTLNIPEACTIRSISLNESVTTGKVSSGSQVST
jgi:hypothetical protein